MAKVICVVSEKGGVGKTALACHLAWAAQDAGQTVLLGDLDTQGNASQRLSGDMSVTKRRKGGSEQLWLNENEASYNYTKGLGEGMKILHGHKGLEALDKKDEFLSASLAMRDRIRTLPFDRVIFDTPPSIGLRVASPLLWSDLAIVVIEPSAEAIAGLGDTIETVKLAQRQNTMLKWRLVINCVVRSSRIQGEIRKQLGQLFKRELLSELGRRQPVADALGEHLPVWRSGARDKELKNLWLGLSQNIVNLKV